MSDTKEQLKEFKGGFSAAEMFPGYGRVFVNFKRKKFKNHTDEIPKDVIVDRKNKEYYVLRHRTEVTANIAKIGRELAKEGTEEQKREFLEEMKDFQGQVRQWLGELVKELITRLNPNNKEFWDEVKKGIDEAEKKRKEGDVTPAA